MRDHCAEQKRMSIVCAKIIFRMMHMRLAVAFSRLTEWIREERQMRFIANKIVKRWRRLELAFALDEWRMNSKLQKHATASHGNAAIRVQRIHALCAVAASG